MPLDFQLLNFVDGQILRGAKVNTAILILHLDRCGLLLQLIQLLVELSFQSLLLGLLLLNFFGFLPGRLITAKDLLGVGGEGAKFWLLIGLGGLCLGGGIVSRLLLLNVLGLFVDFLGLLGFLGSIIHEIRR